MNEQRFPRDTTTAIRSRATRSRRRPALDEPPHDRLVTWRNRRRPPSTVAESSCTSSPPGTLPRCRLLTAEPWRSRTLPISRRRPSTTTPSQESDGEEGVRSEPRLVSELHV